MSFVKLEKKGPVAVITINRPEKRNSLSREVRRELYKRVKTVDAAAEIRAAIITGAGEAFVAGADIAAMQRYQVKDAIAASKEGSDLFLYIENMKIPVIAAINGWALGGGCELALSCDIRICSENAAFGQPEVKIGIIPGYGANIRLPRIIGEARAKELIYLGRIIDAVEAEKIGLVNLVVHRDLLMSKAMDLAVKMAEGPASISLAKRAINEAFDLNRHEATALSSRLYGEVYKTRDAMEGIGAYLEKRKPKFSGK